MKLQDLFSVCDHLVQERIKQKPDAGIKTPSGERFKYKEISKELRNLSSWCYQEPLDVQNVVRCKQCKHYKRYKTKGKYKGYQIVQACELTKLKHDPEFYCSDGLERED